MRQRSDQFCGRIAAQLFGVSRHDLCSLGNWENLESAVLRRDSGHEWGARAGVAVCEAQAVGAVEALIAVAAGGVVGQHGSVRPLACNNNAGKLALLTADKHVLAINLPIQKTVPIALVFLGVVGLVGKPGAVASNHEIAVQSVKLFDGFYDLKCHDLCDLGCAALGGQKPARLNFLELVDPKVWDRLTPLGHGGNRDIQ